MPSKETVAVSFVCCSQAYKIIVPTKSALPTSQRIKCIWDLENSKTSVTLDLKHSQEFSSHTSRASLWLKARKLRTKLALHGAYAIKWRCEWGYNDPARVLYGSV